MSRDSITLHEYNNLPPHLKCNYFVSNTISLKKGVANIAFSDLYSRHGKYKFITNTQSLLSFTSAVGAKVRSKKRLFCKASV